MGGRTPGVKSIAEIEHGALYVIFWIRAIRVDCNHKRSFPARARELHRTSGRSIGGRSDDNSLACGSGAADGIGGGQYDVKRARTKIYMCATGLLRASSIAPVNDCRKVGQLGISIAVRERCNLPGKYSVDRSIEVNAATR